MAWSVCRSSSGGAGFGVHDGGRVTILVLLLAALAVLAVLATTGVRFLFDDKLRCHDETRLVHVTSSWFIRVVRVKVGLGRSGPRSEEGACRSCYVIGSTGARVRQICTFKIRDNLHLE